MQESQKVTLEETSYSKRRALTIRFCVVALFVTSLIVVLISGLAYYQLRQTGLSHSLLQFNQNVVLQLMPPQTIDEAFKQRGQLPQNWLNVVRAEGVKQLSIYDRQLRPLVPSAAKSVLTQAERTVAQKIYSGSLDVAVIDGYKPKFNGLRALLGSLDRPITGLVSLKDDKGTVQGLLKVVQSYRPALERAETVALSILACILIASLLLFVPLFFIFRKGLQTIESQEKKLNQQIERLSNLLLINKSMQKSMKTASARAVELNEQFLRRVGSDLHDGPAQSIGYAVLRLDKIAKADHAKEFTQDFHVVKEALDSSLDEIRGISTGLVLPELASMTLQQSLEKVISRHASNSNTEVTQYYQDLPVDLALPIKICAYRFVQEGLNNAHRHGRAKKCRVNANVKDDVLHLTLKDNGIGFRKSQLKIEGGHLGLMGLKDRIESLGGRFSINSELGVGTAIRVSIAISDDV